MLKLLCFLRYAQHLFSVFILLIHQAQITEFYWNWLVKQWEILVIQVTSIPYCLSHLIELSHNHCLPFELFGIREICPYAGPPTMCELRNAWAQTLPSVVMHSLVRLLICSHSVLSHQDIQQMGGWIIYQPSCRFKLLKILFIFETIKEILNEIWEISVPPLTVYATIKISSFVFQTWTKVWLVWIHMRMSKWWQNLHFCVN